MAILITSPGLVTTGTEELMTSASIPVQTSLVTLQPLTDWVAATPSKPSVASRPTPAPPTVLVQSSMLVVVLTASASQFLAVLLLLTTS